MQSIRESLQGLALGALAVDGRVVHLAGYATE
jgi:hypothetical protein